MVKIEIELDGPYEMMYREMEEDVGSEALENDIQRLIQNELHKGYQRR